MIISKKILFVGLCVVIPLSLGALLALYNDSQRDVAIESISATVLPTPKALPDFMLEDHQGNNFSRENLIGKWSMIFFGYTHCPDICPTTLSTLNQVHDILRETSAVDMPEVIFISVDPERDTSILLANYMSYFNEQFIGVTGSLANLKKLTVPLGIFFSISGEADNGSYDVAHSARIMLIDPQGRWRALFSSSADIAEMVADYKKIIAL